MNDANKETSECPSPETLKGYLEGALCYPDKDVIAAHLMHCDPCVQILLVLLKQCPKPTPEEEAQFTADRKKTWHWLEENVLNADELSVSEPIRSWREEDGVIYFSVTSDGTIGEDWIKRLEGNNGFRVGDYAKQVLCSPDFKPTSGVTTEVAVLKGKLFEDNDRITKNIRAEADKRKLTKPNAELACLICEKFTDKDVEAMDLWYIIAMHEPINNSNGDPFLLLSHRINDVRWLNAYYGRPDGRWFRDGGFAFAVSQVSSQS